jgi:hypothetical protein
MNIFQRLSIAALVLIAAHAHAQLGPVPLNGQLVTPNGALAGRTLSGHLADSLSLLDFGAACDGVTDDSAAITAAASTGKRINVPDGTICKGNSIVQFIPFGNFAGPGKIRDSSGNLRGPRASGVSSSPNPSSWNSTTNANDNCVAGFQCWANFDYSHALSAEEWYITDTAGGHTLGQPAHGYQYMPGAYPHTMFFNNASGWNNSLTGNDGRTAAVQSRVIAQQNGAGDMMVHEAEILCAGHAQPGTTSWLAVPGCSYEAGDINALLPGQYLQHSEWHFGDGGNDVAAVGRAMGYNRTATPANLNNRWVNEFVTCTGSVACDAAYEVTGKWRIGIDFTEITTSINAAIAMAAGQKITLNGTWTDGEANPAKTTLGGEWLTFDPVTNTVQLAHSGAAVLQLSNPAAGSDGTPTATNHMQIIGSASGGPVYFGAAGGDAAISLLVQDKGGAGVLTTSNNNFVLKQLAPVTTNSYAQIGPGSPGQPYTLQVLSAVPTDLNLLAASGGTVHIVGSARLDMHTPASSTEACTAGQTTFDTNYHYDCVATNTWRRVALSSF